jgi:hypothetical protein
MAFGCEVSPKVQKHEQRRPQLTEIVWLNSVTTLLNKDFKRFGDHAWLSLYLAKCVDANAEYHLPCCAQEEADSVPELAPLKLALESTLHIGREEFRIADQKISTDFLTKNGRWQLESEIPILASSAALRNVQ